MALSAEEIGLILSLSTMAFASLAATLKVALASNCTEYSCCGCSFKRKIKVPADETNV